MNWSSLVTDVGTLTPGILLGVGAVGALEAFFHRKRERAYVKREEALAEKEKALAESINTDAKLKLIEFWILSNDKMVQSNDRLEKSNKDLQRYGERMQKEMRGEMNELKQQLATTKHVMTSLVTILERFTPYFKQVFEDENEMQQCVDVLKQARALNH